MGQWHEKTFPGETIEYRKARDNLLKQEMKLREILEETAEMRRHLPHGGLLKEDYLFEDVNSGSEVRFSELFREGKDSLVIYSFMFGPDTDPCALCTSILDGLDGSTPHILERINFVVVAKSASERIHSYAKKRGWHHLRLLSSLRNSYNKDYHAEDPKWGQLPALNVFKKDGDQIHHFYNTELLYTPQPKGMNARHVDLLWPIWNMFDLTPEGRGKDWYPNTNY